MLSCLFSSCDYFLIIVGGGHFIELTYFSKFLNHCLSNSFVHSDFENCSTNSEFFWNKNLLQAFKLNLKVVYSEIYSKLGKYLIG